MKYCCRNSNEFRLKELLDSTKPLSTTPIQVHAAAPISEIDVSKLTYFGASILWRASSHRWRSLKDEVPQLHLGKYNEELRRYLLGETLFPANIVILIGVIPDEKLWFVACPPYGNRINEFWEYRFAFLGIFFSILLGARIDPDVRPLCSFRSKEKFIFTGNKVTEMFTRDFSSIVLRSRAVGALARGMRL